MSPPCPCHPTADGSALPYLCPWGPVHLHPCHQGQLHCAAWAKLRAFSPKCSCRWEMGPALQSDTFSEEWGQLCTVPGHLSMCSLVAVWTRDILMLCIGNMNHGHQHCPLPLHSHGPRHGPQHQLRLGPHHSPRWPGCPLLSTLEHPVPPLFRMFKLLHSLSLSSDNHRLAHCGGSRYRLAPG